MGRTAAHAILAVMTGEISPLGRGLRTGLDTDPTHQSIVPPIYPGTNFAFNGLDDVLRYDYSRAGNPTRDLLGEAICTLEGGAVGVVTSSGLAALTTVFTALVPAGGRVVAPQSDCYGGTGGCSTTWPCGNASRWSSSTRTTSTP